MMLEACCRGAYGSVPCARTSSHVRRQCEARPLICARARDRDVGQGTPAGTPVPQAHQAWPSGLKRERHGHGHASSCHKTRQAFNVPVHRRLERHAFDGTPGQVQGVLQRIRREDVGVQRPQNRPHVSCCSVTCKSKFVARGRFEVE